MPYCHEWDEAKTLPKELFEKASAAGWLPVCVGNWPTVREPALHAPPFAAHAARAGAQAYVGEPPEELKKMDYFHEARLRARVTAAAHGAC